MFLHIFGSSLYRIIKLGFISYVWKVAVLRMLIEPDKPPSQTSSYGPISLPSVIMKLLERVIEKHLRKHLEDNGFCSKYQSGFRKSKSTIDHLFRLSQTVMESFQSRQTCNSGLPRCRESLRQCLDSGTKFTSLICPPSFLGGSPIS